MAPARAYVAACASALVGTLQLGYHHSVYNQPIGIMQQFVNKSYKQSTGSYPSAQLLSVLWSLTVSLFAGGLLIGSVSGSSVVIDRLGRKPALLSAAVIGILGSAIQVAAFFLTSAAYWLLPLGRFVNGLSTGVGTNAQAVYLSEIAPTKHRGRYGVFATLFLALGTLIANIFARSEVLGNVGSWYALSIVPIGFCIAYIVIALFTHESPKFLSSTRGRDDLALQSLKFYNSSDENLDQVLETIKEEAREQNAGLIGLAKLIWNYPGYQKAFWVALMLAFIVPFSGVFLMYSYLAEVASSAGLSVDLVNALSIIYPCIDVVCSLLGAFLIEYVGRRRLLTFGAWVVTGCLSAIFVCQVLIEHRLGSYEWIQAFLLTAIIGHVIVKSSAISSVSFVLPYELFPTPVRGAVASYVCALGVDLGDLLLLFAYLPLKQQIGGYSLAVLFVAPMLVIAVILTIYTPETKGLPVSEVYLRLVGSPLRPRGRSSESRERLLSEVAQAYGTFIADMGDRKGTIVVDLKPPLVPDPVPAANTNDNNET